MNTTFKYEENLDFRSFMKIYIWKCEKSVIFVLWYLIISSLKNDYYWKHYEEITKHVKKQPPCSFLHNIFLKVKCEHNIEAKDLREKCHMGANWLLMSVALHYLNSSSLSHVKKPVPFSGLANLLKIHNIGLIDLYSIPKHLVYCINFTNYLTFTS